ncbi:MAG TPA: glycosyltransferase family 4 protein [Thermoanaerobaculia bacterium]|nr:glycosyltransferase family 4 protein [Thermoanaerobaculia bacterium]
MRAEPFVPVLSPRVGYVVKRFPRYSETFIVNEILAHEAAGVRIEIFSLRPPNDTHFQDSLSRVRAPVSYVPFSSVKAVEFWQAVEAAAEVCPAVWSELHRAVGDDPHDVYQALVLAREVAIREIDHLHAHFATTPASVARLAAFFAGIPFSFTAHAKDIFHESVRPADLARKLSEAQAVVTVSDYNAEFLRQSLGSAAARVRRVYNGLELVRFPYRDPQDRKLEIVAVGRLVEKKGFGDLVAACSLLAGWGRDFRCEIIGTGPLQEDLARLVESHGLEEQVVLLGPRPRSEIIERVSRASVFVAPCVIGSDGDRDGLPTALLEAMALGTPCISTEVTGIPEVLHDGETGLLVRPGAWADLALAIARLLDDANLRVRLARAARRLIEREFDLERNAAQLRDVFDSGRASRASATGAA